jgi:hypothetical protein
MTPIRLEVKLHFNRHSAEPGMVAFKHAFGGVARKIVEDTNARPSVRTIEQVRDRALRICTQYFNAIVCIAV